MIVCVPLMFKNLIVALTRISQGVVQHTNALVWELGDSGKGKFGLIADESVYARNLDGDKLYLSCMVGRATKS